MIKPIFIKINTIIKLKNTGAKVFSFFPDDFQFKKNISRDFLKAIRLFDYTFWQNKLNLEELRKEGFKKIDLLWPAFDKICHKRVRETNKKTDILFVGTYANERRVEILEKICQTGYKVKIFGNGWEKIKKESCLRRNKCLAFKPIYCWELAKEIAKSKIVLNFLRQHNRDIIDSRTFELPAMGAFVIHEESEEVKKILKSEEEVVFFSDWNDLKDKINYYLANKSERNRIAKQATIKINGFSYIKRAGEILNTYNKLNAK